MREMESERSDERTLFGLRACYQGHNPTDQNRLSVHFHTYHIISYHSLDLSLLKSTCKCYAFQLVFSPQYYISDHYRTENPHHATSCVLHKVSSSAAIAFLHCDEAL